MTVPLTPDHFSKIVDNVFGNEHLSRSQAMSYYNDVFQCATSYGYDCSSAQLYQTVTNTTNYVVSKILERGNDKAGEDLLIWYDKEWKHVISSSKDFEHIFAYMNRHWVAREVDEGNAVYFLKQTFVLNRWRNNLFATLGEKITDAILNQIRKERCGEKIDMELIRSILNSYVTMNDKDVIVDRKVETTCSADLYKEKFENHFIEETRKFYKLQSVHQLSESNILDYMAKVSTHFDKEYELANGYLLSTLNTVLATLEEILITPHLEFIQSHFMSLLECTDKDRLRIMYKCCVNAVNAGTRLHAAVESHIVNKCLKAVNELDAAAKQNPSAYIDELLKIYECYSELVKDSFENLPEFNECLDQAATIVVTPHIELLHSEITLLFDQMDKDSLERIYSPCSRVENFLNNVYPSVENSMIRTCKEEIETIEDSIGKDPKAYVMKIVELYKRYSSLVANMPLFNQSVDKGALEFINRNSITVKNNHHDERKTAELLARYCDGILRNKTLDERELEIDRMATVFQFVEDKDIFLKIYIRMLSKRLIDKTSVSDDAERDFITKFSNVCGSDYTHRLTQMITDVNTSKDSIEDFEEQHQKIFFEEHLPEFKTLIVKSGSWPSMSPISISLPVQMSRCLEHFNKFYNEKHNGRKLTWVLGQSRGELSANYCGSRKTLVGSCRQIAILLLYNDKDSYTIGELVAATGMDRKSTAITMAALVKSGLLKGNDLSEATDYDNSETCDLNVEYRNTKVKVDLTKYVVRPVKAKDEEDKENLRSLVEDRMIVIKACIVRIMKESKTIKHQDLTISVLEEISKRFKPRVESIKKCIEILIEREYIKRKEDANDIYEYIA